MMTWIGKNAFFCNDMFFKELGTSTLKSVLYSNFDYYKDTVDLIIQVVAAT